MPAIYSQEADKDSLNVVGKAGLQAHSGKKAKEPIIAQPLVTTSAGHTKAISLWSLHPLFLVQTPLITQWGKLLLLCHPLPPTSWSRCCHSFTLPLSLLVLPFLGLAGTISLASLQGEWLSHPRFCDFWFYADDGPWAWSFFLSVLGLSQTQAEPLSAPPHDITKCPEGFSPIVRLQLSSLPSFTMPQLGSILKLLKI